MLQITTSLGTRGIFFAFASLVMVVRRGHVLMLQPKLFCRKRTEHFPLTRLAIPMLYSSTDGFYKLIASLTFPLRPQPFPGVKTLTQADIVSSHSSILTAFSEYFKSMTRLPLPTRKCSNELFECQCLV